VSITASRTRFAELLGRAHKTVEEASATKRLIDWLRG
jgi:hypothetical protein